MKKYILFSIILVSVLWFLLLFFFISTVGTVKATTNNVTCSGDITSTLNSAISNASPGDTINIGAGSCSIGTITFNKGLTIIGAGKTSTTIAFGVIRITGTGSGDYSLGNFTLTGSSGSDMFIDGGWDSLKIYSINWNSTSVSGIRVGESNTWNDVFYGINYPSMQILITDITYAPASSSGAGKPFLFIYGRGHRAWQEEDGFGTNNFVFIEDSHFLWPSYNGNYVTDTDRGARFVFRHNTLVNAGLGMHDFGSTPLGRGNRAVEVYDNTFTCNSNCGNSYALNMTRGGTALFYNNTLSGYAVLNNPMIYRVAYDSGNNPPYIGWGCLENEGSKICQDATARCDGGTRDRRPGKYPGDCPGGTVGGFPCTTNADCLDANGNVTLCMQVDGLGRTGGEATGWPCRDQTGRGMDNPTTGQQAASPLYWWNNSQSYSAGSYGDYIQNNRDYCTHSPATDCGTKAGWVYTSYTYPHPLQGAPPQTCSDGTSYGQCSSTKPLYCSSVTLINNCQTCGCPANQSCQTNGACQTATQYFLPEQYIQAELGALSGMQSGVSGSDSYIYTNTDNVGSASFIFNIAAAGKYLMQARTNNNIDGGQNSFYVGLDSEAAQNNVYYTYNIFPLALGFLWDNVNRWGNGLSGDPPVSEFDPMVWDLTADLHTFTFYGREANTWLDQIILKRVTADTTPPTAPTGLVVI